MKNKGFTLIELLGVTVILALIVLLVFPNIINTFKKSSDQTDDLTETLIYNMADIYISNHKNDFPKKNGNKFAIYLTDLIDEEYLSSPIKLSDGEDITNKKCVQVVYAGYFIYSLTDNDNCVTYITTESLLMGDMNKDGVVSKMDARLALEISVKNLTMTDYHLSVGDFDSDGVITAHDALKILQICKNLIGSPNYPDMGDANEDGTVDKDDSDYILAISVGSITVTDAEMKKLLVVADFDENGVLDASDALVILQIVEGLK